MLPAHHCAATQVEEHLSEKKINALCESRASELCTDFLLHFKVVLLLLLWLVTVVLLQETSRVAGQLAEGMAGEEGPFNYFPCPVVFSPFSEVLVQSWLKDSVKLLLFLDV